MNMYIIKVQGTKWDSYAETPAGDKGTIIDQIKKLFRDECGVEPEIEGFEGSYMPNGS